MAQRTRDAVAVTFWTTSSLGSVHISEHIDRYAPGSVHPVETSMQTLAEGPGGYVF